MVKVVESAIIDAPIEEVWHIVRDFNSHWRWHPAIAESSIEDGHAPDVVGAVRAFSLQDGGFLREQLIRLDDRAHELSYCLLEAPLPLYNYVATIRLKPVTDSGKTFWQWESNFKPPKEREAELVSLVSGAIYRDGMRALETFVRQDEGHLEVQRNPELPASGKTPEPPKDGVGDTSSESTTAHAAAGAGGILRGSAIVMEQHGGPEVLRLKEVEAPPPAAGEVRIRQSHAGVNFIDVYCRTGYFNLVSPPGIPGMEAAGTVESVGPGVMHLSAGDRVAYACPPPGAYTSVRTMNGELVTRLPDFLSGELAAASLLKGITAGFLLHDVATVRAGDGVVVHAAAGGVGSLLVQWARALGAHVIATVSSAEKAAYASNLGAQDIVIGRGREFIERVQEITLGRGADVIFDAIGRDTFDNSLEALAVRGHLVSYGQASGDIGARNISALAAKSVTLSRPNYGHFVQDRAMMELQAQRFFSAVHGNDITIAPPALYPLAEAARAHSDLESGATTGSVVLQI